MERRKGLFIRCGIVGTYYSRTGRTTLSGCSASEGRFNTAHELDKAKVVNSYDIEDLGDKVAFCRCWKSKKFPYCDGTHNAHNKLTGDNLGPVCLSRKESTA
uniref:Iron-binding zinc finger CDGSH type domain-containing protein n=1 Tax=Clytia hemisphaerica TaxID=252671 RepID=A0A7M5XE22_9CNID